MGSPNTTNNPLQAPKLSLHIKLEQKYPIFGAASSSKFLFFNPPPNPWCRGKDSLLFANLQISLRPSDFALFVDFPPPRYRQYVLIVFILAFRPQLDY